VPSPEAPVPPSQPPAANGTSHPVAVAVAPPPGVELELDALRSVWPAVIESLVASGNRICAAALAEARPVAVSDGEVTVAFPPEADYHRRRADDDEYRACVAAALREVTGAKARVAYVREEEVPGGREEAAPMLAGDELVQHVVAKFDAEEIDPESEAS
jgi:hypothetical protein